MARIILFLFLLSQAFFLNAQIQEVAVSDHFKTLFPENIKLVSLSNSQTMLVRLHEFNKLNVHIYDESRKEVVHHSTKLPIKDIKNSYPFGIVETINGDVSFYLLLRSQGSDRVVFQILLDGKTGEVKSCNELMRASKKTYGGMWASFIEGSGIGFEQSENKAYSVLYLKNYDAEKAEHKQEIWLMDKMGKIIEKTGINLDKEGKYPKGIGLIGLDITNDGTVYAITSYYKSDEDMKRFLTKKELNKAAQSYKICGVPDKADLLGGILKYNSIKNEIIYINIKNEIFKFDDNGVCKKEMFSVRELKRIESEYIKTRKTDKFIYKIYDVIIDNEGNYTYTIGLTLERLETHNRSIQDLPYPYIAGYILWSEQNNKFSFVPTFVRGDVTFGKSSHDFTNLRESDAKGFTIFSNQNKKYFLFNDNEDSRNNIEEDKNLKRIQKKGSLEGFYAEAISNNGLSNSAPIEKTTKGSTFYYFATGDLVKNGTLAVIKLLDGDKMQVAWLKIKE